MTAFNYERYIVGALRSVLEQDYPPELLDVVVVDDGSTDGTAGAVASIRAVSDGRIQLVRQRNGGLAAATQTALERAGGDLIAICDADDEWLPGKVAAEVEVLARRPEVSLVYGDMQVIDATGTVLDTSFFRRQRVAPLRGHVLDQLVAVNFTTNSTLMFRARDLTPIPAECPYADYWLVMHAAAAGVVELIDRPLANYRLHSANMSFGAAGERLVRESIREVVIRRLILTAGIGGAVAPETLADAALQLQLRAHQVSAESGVPLAQVVSVSDDQRVRARESLRQAATAREARERLRLCALALLLDPQSLEIRDEVEKAVAAARHSQLWADVPPVPAVPGPMITIASAAELLRTPRLAAAYCARMADITAATLFIVADCGELEDTANRLRAALTSVDIDPDDCPDMTIVPATVEPVALGPSAALTAEGALTLCPSVPVMPLV